MSVEGKYGINLRSVFAIVEEVPERDDYKVLIRKFNPNPTRGGMDTILPSFWHARPKSLDEDFIRIAALARATSELYKETGTDALLGNTSYAAGGLLSDTVGLPSGLYIYKGDSGFFDDLGIAMDPEYPDGEPWARVNHGTVSLNELCASPIDEKRSRTRVDINPIDLVTNKESQVMATLARSILTSEGPIDIKALFMAFEED